jgi:hypothetical protein
VSSHSLKVYVLFYQEKRRMKMGKKTHKKGHQLNQSKVLRKRGRKKKSLQMIS